MCLNEQIHLTNLNIQAQQDAKELNSLYWIHALGLKVTRPNLLAAVGVVNVNPIKKLKREKITHCSWLTFVVLTRINLYLIYTVKSMRCHFTFDFSVSVPKHLQTCYNMYTVQCKIKL